MLTKAIDDKNHTIAMLRDEIEVTKKQNDEDCDQLKDLIEQTKTIMVVKVCRSNTRPVDLRPKNGMYDS